MTTNLAKFNHRWLPLWLTLPQLILIMLFFYWPAIQTLLWSFTLERAFGGGETNFVGLYNFKTLFKDPALVHSLSVSAIFAISTTAISIVAALVLAIAANSNIKFKCFFQNILVWPYAISAPVVGVTFSLLMHPTMGVFSILNKIDPDLWQPYTNSTDAMIMIILASAWIKIPFFFIIFLSGLQGIPENVQHIAAIDGAGAIKRLLDIQLPLMTPYLFFAFVTGIIDSLTGSFGIINTMTQGGPGDATNLLIYKIYVDGFVGLDFSESSALSTLLMLLVIFFTLMHFLFIQKKVHYQ